MRRIVLASQSPRRKQLLENMGVTFVVAPSEFEEYLDDTRSPEEVSIELGLGKARTVAERYPDAIVIGSDTIVTVHGHQLAKAESDEQACEMWRLLAGTENTVTTSIVMVCKDSGAEFTSAETSTVYMKPYDAEAIEAYLQTGDYKDKAGAYSLQGASHLIDRYEGDPEAILGFPTSIVAEMLDEFAQSE
ncbi:septum formation protein Maf [Candidatus Saccharibacteria bacterium]|nr:septum formation protein Maf [Candidatus Saccharibacteria bacterium]